MQADSPINGGVGVMGCHLSRLSLCEHSLHREYLFVFPTRGKTQGGLRETRHVLFVSRWNLKVCLVDLIVKLESFRDLV